MSKTLDDWRNYWDNANKSFEEESKKYPDGKKMLEGAKTISLLSEYSKTEAGIGGGFFRFITGKWNTHHGDAAQNVVMAFRNPTIESGPEYVDNILARLKQEIGNNAISPNGDLYKILQVIKEKTNIDYFELNPNEASRNVRSSSF